MNPDHRFAEPIMILIASGISFLVPLVSYIITAVAGYYDDGYGVSYLYGRKDFLILMIASGLLVGLASYVLIQAKRRKKTDDWVRPVFLVSSAAVFSFFIFAQALKPIVENEFGGENLMQHVCNLVSAFFGLLAIIFGVVLLINLATKKLAYHSLVATILLMVCFVLAVDVYCIPQGILGLRAEHFFIAISLFTIAASFTIQLIPMIISAKDLRKF